MGGRDTITFCQSILYTTSFFLFFLNYSQVLPFQLKEVFLQKEGGSGPENS